MRDTDITKALFPVDFRKIFFEETTDKGTLKVPISKYRALIDTASKQTFCVVGEDYQLVTNEEALELGEQAFKELFGTVNTDDLTVFNVITPGTRSHCHIDLIHKDYEVNIWKKEVYLPYIRVTNSYNRSRALRFDLGFVRKLCDNGVIFEREAIEYKYDHTRTAFRDKIDFAAQHGRLKALEKKFIDYMTKLSDFSVPRQYGLPLMVKALDMRFAIDNSDPKKKQNAERRLREFTNSASLLVNSYFKEIGENAYAIYNAATDYASNPPLTGSANLITGLQKCVGDWVEAFTTQPQPLNFNEYLNEPAYFTPIQQPQNGTTR